MAWVVIRNATEQDYEAIEKSAEKFCKRHNIRVNKWESDETAIENFAGYLDDCKDDCGYTMRLWQKCLSRAVEEPGATGIAWGAIGHPE